MVRIGVVASLLVLACGWAGPGEAARKAAAPTLDAAAINSAAPGKPTPSGVDPVAIKAAVLLDRAHFSPGVVDGRWGDNLGRAVRGYQSTRGLPESGTVDAETWTKLTGEVSDPPAIEYEIMAADVDGPFLDKVPAKLEAMQGLKHLSYTSPRELLAEKFHMSEALIQALNPGQDFRRSGSMIVVAHVTTAESAASNRPKVARLEVRKADRMLVALDADGKLLASYPATIGSADKPAPVGTFEVKAVAHNPPYTYNPDYKFKGVKARSKFAIAGGPNNPVGSVWISLSAPSYGIHGTPEPDRVGKTFSHGCIRLTNWDANEVAGLVKKGTPVAFKD